MATCMWTGRESRSDYDDPTTNDTIVLAGDGRGLLGVGCSSIIEPNEPALTFDCSLLERLPTPAFSILSPI